MVLRHSSYYVIKAFILPTYFNSYFIGIQDFIILRTQNVHPSYLPISNLISYGYQDIILFRNHNGHPSYLPISIIISYDNQSFIFLSESHTSSIFIYTRRIKSYIKSTCWDIFHFIQVKSYIPHLLTRCIRSNIITRTFHHFTFVF